MSDLKQRILDIIGQPQLMSLATVNEDGLPWVRYMVGGADESMTIQFATFIKSRKIHHVRGNPEVHITAGSTSVSEMKPYVQIQARAKVVTDIAAKEALWCDELGDYFSGPDDPNYAILRIKPYRIEYLTPGNLTPEVWEAQE